MGLRFSDGGYQFYQYAIAKNNPKSWTWQPLTNPRVFAYQPIPNYIKVSLTLDAASLDAKSTTKQFTPTMVLSSSGNITPFSIDIGRQHKPPLYKIVGKFSGEVSFITVVKQ